MNTIYYETYMNGFRQREWNENVATLAEISYLCHSN